MTSSGEMSPAMMQIPGTWSALAGVLMGVFRSALFTSLTPRCKAPAFRAVQEVFKLAVVVREDKTLGLGLAWKRRVRSRQVMFPGAYPS